MAVEAKICGLTRPEDAALATAHGAWRLGVIFAGGPRAVSPEQAREIVAAANGVPVIGVYRSHSVESILKMSAIAGLRGVQLDGDYSGAQLKTLRDGGLEVWQVMHLDPRLPLPTDLAAAFPAAEVVLIEPRHPDRLAGERAALDLGVARRARQVANGISVALAGGLTPDSVAEAIRVVGPDAVDVSSGIEQAPGIKDPAKLVRFLEHVRDAHPPA